MINREKHIFHALWSGVLEEQAARLSQTLEEMNDLDRSMPNAEFNEQMTMWIDVYKRITRNISQLMRAGMLQDWELVLDVIDREYSINYTCEDLLKLVLQMITFEDVDALKS